MNLNNQPNLLPVPVHHKHEMVAICEHPGVPPSDQQFIKGLLSYLAEKGGLSKKQFDWFNKLHTKYLPLVGKNILVPPPVAYSLGDLLKTKLHKTKVKPHVVDLGKIKSHHTESSPIVTFTPEFSAMPLVKADIQDAIKALDKAAMAAAETAATMHQFNEVVQAVDKPEKSVIMPTVAKRILF